MSKQDVAEMRWTVSEEILEELRKREHDPNRGVGDWDAFDPVNREDWGIYQMWDNLTAEDDATLFRSPHLRRVFLPQSLLSVIMAGRSIYPNVRSVEEEFNELANQWHDETDLLSSPSRITGSDTYLKIISMGRRVIPLILEDLRERGGNWYRALRIISDDDPVSVEARGNVEQMKQAWLQWGRSRGYTE